MTGLLHIQGFCRLAILSAGELITLEKICDPFMGSGTVALCAERLGCHWLGIELNEQYSQLHKARTEGMTQSIFL
jgi:tRNA G10  N-methylase Trm11